MSTFNEELNWYLDYLNHRDIAKYTSEAGMLSGVGDRDGHQSISTPNTEDFAVTAVYAVIAGVIPELSRVHEALWSEYKQQGREVLAELVFSYAVLHGQGVYNGSAMSSLKKDVDCGIIGGAVLNGIVPITEINLSAEGRARAGYMLTHAEDVRMDLFRFAEKEPRDAVVPLTRLAVKILEELKQPSEEEEKEEEEERETVCKYPVEEKGKGKGKGKIETDIEIESESEEESIFETEQEGSVPQGEKPPESSDEGKETKEADRKVREHQVEEVLSQIEKEAKTKKEDEALNPLGGGDADSEGVGISSSVDAGSGQAYSVSGFPTRSIKNSLHARLLLNEFADWKLIKQGKAGQVNRKVAQLPFGELDIFKQNDTSSSQLIIMVDCSASTSCRCGLSDWSAKKIGTVIWDIAGLLGRAFTGAKVFAYSQGVTRVPSGHRLLCPQHERKEGMTMDGGTPEAEALEVMERVLGAETAGATGVIITDGRPDDPYKCTQVAERLINKGVRFCAVIVSTGGQNRNESYYTEHVRAEITNEEDLLPIVNTFRYLGQRH